MKAPRIDRNCLQGRIALSNERGITMKSTRTAMIVSTLALCAGMFLGDWPAMAQKPPGKGGGKKMDFPVTLELRDDPSDRIFSDGGPYVDGTDGVNTRIRDTGGLLFNIGGTRWVGLDFSEQAEPPECGQDCNKNFVVTNTGDSPGAAGSVQAVDDSGNVLSGGLLGMSVNESRRAMMKLGWGGSGSGNEPRWSVRFKKTTSDPGIDTSISNKSTFFEITRTGQDTWIIEAIEPSVFPDAGDRALLWSRTGNGKRQTYLDEGTYHMRFSMTVTRAPSGGEGGGAALSGTLFLRGDCNDDGTVDLSDAVCTLNWLFLGSSAPGCVAATNTNGDGAAGISDATYLLNHLFLGGPAPVEPFPDCGPGTLQADEELGCETPPKSCE